MVDMFPSVFLRLKLRLSSVLLAAALPDLGDNSRGNDLPAIEPAAPADHLAKPRQIARGRAEAAGRTRGSAAPVASPAGPPSGF